MSQTELQYEELMKQARKYALELSLLPDVEAPNLKIPSKIQLTDFLNTISPTADFFNRNCMVVGSLRPSLEERGFSGGEVTIGYVRFNNDNEFFTTKEALANELAAPGDAGISLHVWITYPGGIIFDPTILATFEADRGTPLQYVSTHKIIIFDRVSIPSIPVEMEYIPLLTGSDYLYKTNSQVSPNQEFNSYGSQHADDVYNNTLIKGAVYCLTDGIEFYKEKYPENYNAVIIGIMAQFKEYEDLGLLTRDARNEKGEIYYTATPTALKHSAIRESQTAE